LPTLANSTGWIFTEMGRQPWSVFGLMSTADGVSPTVSAGTVLTSLIVFTVLYGALAVVDGVLMYRYAKAGPPDPAPPESDVDTEEPVPVFAY
jgi:cytochrome d ubiquinol oxidase subunit I